MEKKKKASGFIVVRGTPGNILDAFDMYKRIWKESWALPKLTEPQQKEYYWQLLEELSQPTHMVLFLKRGAKIFGMLHAVIVQKPLGQPAAFFVKNIYVLDSKRKRGGGKMLLDEMVFLAGRFGVKNFDFMAPDELVEYWGKKRKALKVANYMTFEV